MLQMVNEVKQQNDRVLKQPLDEQWEKMFTERLAEGG